MMSECGGDGSFDVEADGITDLVEGDGQLVLYGFDRDIQYFGHFPVFQAIFLCQLEDHFAFGREAIDGFLDQREHIGRDEQLFGVEVDAGEFGGEVFEVVGGVTFLFVEVIEGDIAGRDIEVYL